MSRGDVFLHSNFPFYDGTFGKKYFVVIFEPKNDSGEPYLVLKTTSNLRGYQYNIGCNESKSAFFIPSKNAKVFPIDTLIQLYEIYEFTISEFLMGSLTDKTIVFKETLIDLHVSQLINCIKKLKDDISMKHLRLITNK